MEPYQKINGLYKRYADGPKKGRFIMGDWAQPEFEFLANNKWQLREKVDGANTRIGFTAAGVEFGGRTDRAVIQKPLLEYLQDTFTYDLFTQVFDGADVPDVTLYGEGYGPDIQSGGKYTKDHKFVLFDVLIDGWWLKQPDIEDIASKLGIDSVPILGYGTIQDAIDIVSSGLTWDSNGKMTNWGGGTIKGLRSTWGNFEAEGIVAVTDVPLFNRKGERIITKIKAVDFKTKVKK